MTLVSTIGDLLTFISMIDTPFERIGFHEQLKFHAHEKMFHNLKVWFVLFIVFLLATCIIVIAHVFSCINICRGPRKLFEREAIRLSVLTSSDGPAKG